MTSGHSAAPASAPTAPPPSAATSAGPSATHRLTVQPGGWQLPVAPGQTLLRAARAAGLRLPSSCRNGSCRACMARLRSGRAHHTVDWPGLLAEEQAEGWILPCVACADSDLVIDAPGAEPLPGGAFALQGNPAVAPGSAGQEASATAGGASPGGPP